MPGLLQYEADLANTSSTTQHPDAADSSPDHAETFATRAGLEDAQLWLPSALTSSARARVCQRGLAEIEDRLRTAQCTDSLRKIQQVLRVKSRMIHFKNKNVRGQRDGTRSRAVIDRIHLRARNAADRYRAARRTKLALVGPGSWEESFRILEDKDIRGYQDPDRLRPKTGRKGTIEDGQDLTNAAVADIEPGQEFELFNEPRSRRDGTGETRRTLSWIWTSCNTPDSETDKDELLRVEWAKSRARANRGDEEVKLLKEEMRRVLAFLAWKSAWWRERAAQREGLGGDLAESLQAFASEQANLQEDLANKFRRLWKAPLEDVDKAIAQNDTGHEEKEGKGLNEENGGDGEEDNEDEDEDEDGAKSDGERSQVEEVKYNDDNDDDDE